MDFESFFTHAVGFGPYAYQKRLAERLGDTDALIAPTGLGKTAAVTLAWAWARSGLDRPPRGARRLVWCLPMRTLVEQTAAEAATWFRKLGDHLGQDRLPKVYKLMGGDVDEEWRLHPEQDAVLVGTQDMLVSRALMRGYGMSRFGWPIDYGLLHTDALWVFDEVQLMGASLATSAQLEGFRRGWSKLRPRSVQAEAAQGWPSLASSLWLSATLRPEWLSTAEFRPPLKVLDWKAYDADAPAVRARVHAVKHLAFAETVLDVDAARKPAAYGERLAREALSLHRPGRTTLVIVNTVRRAQAIDAALAKLRPDLDRLLVHSRFRPSERAERAQRLRAQGERIVVATQAVEAGVDLTSAVLLTELAPVSSLVQRFGRCNRGGELNADGGAVIRVIDAELDGKGGVAAPYDEPALAAAREALAGLEGDASPSRLESLRLERPNAGGQVIRPKDFEELFDTDADLSGYDLDISPYIREGDDLAVQLFWRDWNGDEDAKGQEPPHRAELCPAPIGEAKSWIERRKDKAGKVYMEDALRSGHRNRAGGWRPLGEQDRIRPGQTLMLAADLGGYTKARG